MGGPNDLLPFNIWDETSDTESDENAEVVAEHFLSKIDLPERLKNTIPGPGIALTTTSSGLIHFPPKDPTMQSVVDEGGDSFMTDTGYSGQDQFPTVLNDSSPPISTRTPPTTDNPSGFGPRKPDDTRFHHGSAGVDPLGAHGRLLRPTLPPKTRRGRLIVSGSFGTFENTPTSRFDERGYRLLPMSAFSPTPALLTSTASSMEKKKREGDESEDNKKAKKNR
ncbi:hypothetical protein K504DRAFT_460154 [Pleomassaria siparia CBS 279.74]|uniref:Uncharacterized protein n=1 Tax=Pleomassaria siparia CBS 279.74 TaxID=1314801 RepID=A0A6G1JZT8_9PLEO|nr:hypothetical protein K504DRAFT_460154 [Pleomassaria siparia CBS 279.74]